MLSNINRLLKLTNMSKKWISTEELVAMVNLKALKMQQQLKLDDEILDANVLDIERNVIKLILIIH